ncbi:MAG: T9SS type A sorting domain-containing protein [Bacteroidetes bacterium]|nr:T9SS type A sorting domain-containing protein [Bacteroidota bacterium]
MRKLLLLFVALVAANLTSHAAAPVKTITGNITGNVMWNYDTIYLLSGKVYLINGATLTIAPGTIIKGDYSAAGSALIVTRGAKIYAIGEPSRPIVFTSSQTPGNRATGDWGGLVIAGNAKVNVPGGIGTFEGGNLANPNAGGGGPADGQFGGLNDLDNSGELKYVRIEYAGYPFAPNNELNGLTMGGVGSGTKISYVQVSYGFDDSFEWFGGTVSCNHLISYRTNDDDFDSDFGFRGNIQFGVAMRDTAVADAVSGANCFESDNDATGTNLTPLTAPVYSNMTLVGPQFTPSTTINANFKRGAHIRRNSRASIFNSVFMGWPVGIKIDGDSCHRNADSLWLEVQNSVIAASALPLDSTAGALWNITPWYTAGGNANTTYAANSDGIGPIIPEGIYDITNTIQMVDIYPNPAQNVTSLSFNLSNTKQATIILSDISGNILFSETKATTIGRNIVELNTSGLASGLYIIKIVAGNSFHSAKLNVIKM